MHPHIDVRNQRRAGRGLVLMVAGFTAFSLLMFWWVWQRLPESKRQSSIRVASDVAVPTDTIPAATPVLLMDGDAVVVMERVEGHPVVSLGHCRNCRRASGTVVRGGVVICGACGQTMLRAPSAEAARGCERPAVPFHVENNVTRVAAPDIQHALDELENPRREPIN